MKILITIFVLLGLSLSADAKPSNVEMIDGQPHLSTLLRGVQIIQTGMSEDEAISMAFLKAREKAAIPCLLEVGSGNLKGFSCKNIRNEANYSKQVNRRGKRIIVDAHVQIVPAN